jgi:hypothetical protein
MKLRILLLNPDLTYASGPQFLQGFSGKNYGTSRWYPEYNCHAVELTHEQYDAAYEDLRRAIHLPLRRWFPKIIVESEQAKCSEEAPSEKYTEAQLRQIGKKHFSLIGVAKKVGVDTETIKGGEALIKAILEKQG